MDDPYLDRIQQATSVGQRDSVSEKAALAIPVPSYEEMDWPYVEQHIRSVAFEDFPVGNAMAKVHRRVRRKVLAWLRARDQERRS